jgi:hypothetical protein
MSPRTFFLWAGPVNFEHWGMFSLQSDFIRHSLLNLVGGFVTPHDRFKPLEPYFVLIQNSQLLFCRAQYILTVRLRRIPDKIVSGRLG